MFIIKYLWLLIPTREAPYGFTHSGFVGIGNGKWDRYFLSPATASCASS
jgi:hypothetical protein